MNYKCPCCNACTFGENPDESYEICPVCYWEGDTIQNNDVSYIGGANKVCLKDAKNNYQECGAIHKDYIGMVRKPCLTENK